MSFREMLDFQLKVMESHFYKKGQLEQAIYAVYIVLKDKFGPIDRELELKLRDKKNLKKLNTLLGKVIQLKSIDEVKKIL
ncbi:MAG: hypothetical protein LBF38_10835 [Deltaproteobacteria bacterium]|nr:hypothetical protein [Deltaproteobacteria bacterium]